MDRLLNEIMKLAAKALEGAEEILKITKEMKKHIKNKDVDALSRAIRMRQEKIDEADSVNKEVKEKTDELLKQHSIESLEEIDRKNHPQAEEILDIRRKIKLAYNKALQMDKANYGKAENLLNEYKDAIKDLHANKKAMRVYGGNKERQSILIDETK